MALSISPLSLGLLICFVCSHCCWCLTPPNCSSTAPTKCLFNDTFCDWEPKGWQKSVNKITATTFNNPDHKATVRSQLACNTKSTQRCISFEFFLYDHNLESTLDVVVEENNGNGKSNIWRVKSSRGNWTTGAVTITTTSDFWVSFIATWKADQSPVISLRKFAVEKTACEMKPNWATRGPASEITSTPSTTTKSDGTSGAEGYREQCLATRIPLLGIAVPFYAFYYFLWH